MNPNAVAALVVATAILLAPIPNRLSLSIIHRPVRRWAMVLPAVALAAYAVPPSVTLLAGMAGIVGAVRSRRRRRDRCRRSEGLAMAAALEILVGELRVGAHPLRALTIAAGESAGAVGASLQAVASRAQLGADVSAALVLQAAGSSVPNHWRRLGICWDLAAQYGVAMAVLMSAAHRDIVDRQRFTDRIHAALAGARATAMILAALPLLGILLGQLIGAQPLRFLFGGGLGGVVLVVGIALVCAGLGWADHIIERLVP